ncbi:uncharacterized protein LOC134222710 [Armigeres subalbatus]|uniref:uncharacterized protein LOC134222710 n=1 Tax=Armigeres subalbatus TaxID=124917 RepID=UPI002ED0AD10
MRIESSLSGFLPAQRLNKLQIAKDLAKSFRGIEEVNAPSRNKLRITVSDREQANKIAACELFLREYHVYIPSREVEVAGVVTEPYLSCVDIKSLGAGGFKNRAVPAVQVIDVRQMNRVSSDGTKKTSDSYRVTFSGSALPDYLVIGKLRLPVRLYVPSVMHCTKCQQIGHTETYCCNKPRCSKCGEQHQEGPCSTEQKCTCCGEAPHDLSSCPRFIKRGNISCDPFNSDHGDLMQKC